MTLQLGEKDFLQNTMVDLGENAAPLLADLDGDGKPDLPVGTVAGGVRLLCNTSRLLCNTSALAVTGVEPALRDVRVYPNPTGRDVTVLSPGDGLAEVLTLTGQSVAPP